MDAIPVCGTTEVQWVLAELMVSLTGACGSALPARRNMESNERSVRSSSPWTNPDSADVTSR